jgi:hypothetical protein
VFTGIDLSDGQIKAMMKDTFFIIGTASVAVTLPFVLLEQQVVNIPVASIIFLANYALLHLVLWPRIKNYKAFRSFFSHLVAIRTSKNKVILND